MLVIGLTGSIGMGKSTAAIRLRALGFAVFDADAAVHALYAGEAVPLIEVAFPGSTQDGAVDRQILSDQLGGKPERFAVLESIVHPLVQAEERSFLRAQAAEGATAAILEVPLLFETGLDEKLDAVIVVSASGEEQRRRVLARPGMSAEKFDNIVALQVPDVEKRAKADFVVDTSGSIEASQRQIDDIVEQIASLQGNAFETHWQ